MPPYRRLTNDQRLRAIGMFHAGMSQADVARHFRVHRSVIHRLLNRFAETNSTSDRLHCGRPRCTTPAEDRYLCTSALRSRVVSAVQLRERLRRAGKNVSTQMVQNRLHRAGLRARRPYVGVVLTDGHRRARLAWSRRH